MRAQRFYATGQVGITREAKRLIYVYAFCPTPLYPLALPAGVTQPTVQLVSGGVLAAIVEFDLDISRFKQDDQQLMAAILVHDRVLGRLFQQTALLPLQFGTQFTDEASLYTYLQTHQAAYIGRLRRLSEKAEYLIKLSPKPFPPSSGEERDHQVPGGAPKERVQAQDLARTRQETELQQFLYHLETAGVSFVQSEAREEEERLHLLAERDPAIAQVQLTQWQQQLPSWELNCSEPLPPYHFVS